jgi:hypothetical protein
VILDPPVIPGPRRSLIGTRDNSDVTRIGLEQGSDKGDLVRKPHPTGFRRIRPRREQARGSLEPELPRSSTWSFPPFFQDDLFVSCGSQSGGPRRPETLRKSRYRWLSFAGAEDRWGRSRVPKCPGEVVGGDAEELGNLRLRGPLLPSALAPPLPDDARRRTRYRSLLISARTLSGKERRLATSPRDSRRNRNENQGADAFRLLRSARSAKVALRISSASCRRSLMPSCVRYSRK